MRSRPLLALLATLALSACGGAKASVDAKLPIGDEAPVTSSAAVEPTAAPRPEILFGRKAFAAGVARIEKVWVGRSVLLTANHDNHPITIEDASDEIEEKREEVLEANGGIVTKLKVTILKKSEVGIRNGRPHSKSSVVAGKTYLVAAGKDGVLAVATERGGKVSKPEGDVLARMYGMLGQEDPFLRAVPERPLHAGESVDALASGLKIALARALAHEDERGVGRVAFGNVSVVLSGTRDVGGASCGVFAVRLQVTYEHGGFAGRTDATGEMLFRTADGWPVALELEGPMVFEGEARGTSFGAEGRSHLKMSWSEP